MAVKKPSIAAIPPGFTPAQYAFLESIRQALEATTSRRGGKVDPAYALPIGWIDLLTDIQTRTTGAGTPAYNVFNSPLRAYQFALNDEVYGGFHIPHDWKPGTPFWPHIHWSAISTTTNTVTWRFTWSYARGYGVEAFSTPATLDITQAHCGISRGHNIAETTDSQAIYLPNFETDGIVHWAFKLQTNNMPVDPFAFFVDLHYQSDGRLTNERNRTFTKVAYEDDLINKINEIIERIG
jgi:hypothetical protein